MTAKHLILTLSLTLAAGVAAAALSRGAMAPARPVPAGECGERAPEAAIPRIVVTGRPSQADQSEVEYPRVVVVGHRQREA